MAKLIDFQEWEARQLQDAEFLAEVEELEAGYAVARLRMLKGLTQQQLADLVGTKQSSIARLESGKSQPRLSFLRRIVRALGGKLELRILSDDEVELEQANARELEAPVTPVYRLPVEDRALRIAETAEAAQAAPESGNEED